MHVRCEPVYSVCSVAYKNCVCPASSVASDNLILHSCSDSAHQDNKFHTVPCYLFIHLFIIIRNNVLFINLLLVFCFGQWVDKNESKYYTFLTYFAFHMPELERTMRDFIFLAILG